MKKTVLALIMSLIIVCSLALSVYASNPILCTVSSAEANRGEIVEIKVNATNASGVMAFMFTITYDGNVLTPVSGEWGSVVDGKTSMKEGGTESPVIYCSTATDISGHIYTLKFKVNDNAVVDASTNVTITVAAKDGNYADIPVSVQAGTITITCSHPAGKTEQRPEKPADCKNPGTAAGVYCLDCNKYTSGGDVIPLANHTEGETKYNELTTGRYVLFVQK